MGMREISLARTANRPDAVLQAIIERNFLVSGPRSGNSKAKIPMRATGGNWQTSVKYYLHGRIGGTTFFLDSYIPGRWWLPDSPKNVFRIGFGRIGVSLSGGRRIAPVSYTHLTLPTKRIV